MDLIENFNLDGCGIRVSRSGPGLWSETTAANARMSCWAPWHFPRPSRSAWCRVQTVFPSCYAVNHHINSIAIQNQTPCNQANHKDGDSIPRLGWELASWPIWIDTVQRTEWDFFETKLMQQENIATWNQALLTACAVIHGQTAMYIYCLQINMMIINVKICFTKYFLL